MLNVHANTVRDQAPGPDVLSSCRPGLHSLATPHPVTCHLLEAPRSSQLGQLRAFGVEDLNRKYVGIKLGLAWGICGKFRRKTWKGFPLRF